MSEFDPEADISIGGFRYVSEERYRRVLWALKEIANKEHKWQAKAMREYAEMTVKRVAPDER